MDTVLWVIQVILAIKLLSTAIIHALQQDKDTLSQAIARLGAASKPLLFSSAALMALGSLGLILPGVLRALPWLTPVCAALLAVMLLVSIPLHIKSRDKPMIFVSLILFAMAAFLAYGRWVLIPLA